jgi:peptidoglycan/LPS O-acetylase OafA/YrhL
MQVRSDLILRVSSTTRKNSYRPDIDGLRAVAVLSVLLFHGFPALVPGGFIGVDIFFVISGYLITGILLGNLDRGGLRLFDFYRHRIRRIFPALVIVLSACFAVGWVVLFASEFRQLGKQTGAAAIFISNFELWREAGYFDVASTTKPLLHLWSLAVEEQFYLLWPPLLWLAWRTRLPAIWLSVTCVVVSFALCVVVSQHDRTADFFSPVTRFWEILIGAVLVISERTQTFQPRPALRSAMSLAGAALAVVALTSINQSAPYPGWRAALPVAASLLLIAAGPGAWVNRRVLAWRPLVAIGLISYPLYLWHWPLLAFARILIGATPSLAARAALLASSFVLAALTFVAIEKPLRFGRQATMKMALLCAAMLVLGAAGTDVWQRNGLSFRYIVKHTPATGLAALTRSSPFVHDCTLPGVKPEDGWCYADSREKPSYVVMGDSHAEALFWALVRASRPGERWMLAARSTCAPMVRMVRLTANNLAGHPTADPPQCAAFNRTVLNFVTHADSLKVVLIAVAQRVLENDDYAPHLGGQAVANGAFTGLSNAIALLERSGKKVIFLEDNPSLADSSDCVPRRTGFAGLDKWLANIRTRRRCVVSYSQYVSETAKYRHLVSDLKAPDPGLPVFDTLPVLCDAAADRCAVMRDGKSLYSYGDHLSDYGGSLVARALAPMLQAAGHSAAVQSQEDSDRDNK